MKKLFALFTLSLFVMIGYAQDPIVTFKGNAWDVPAAGFGLGTLQSTTIQNYNAAGNAGFRLIVGANMAFSQLDGSGNYFLINRTGDITFISTGGDVISRDNFTIGDGTAVDYRLNFNALNADGTIIWDETPGEFDFSADINLGANGILITGDIGITGSRARKGWFADLEVTNAPTVSGADVYYSGGPDVVDADIVDALTISGGTIDNSTIGGVTPAAGTFSTATLSGTNPTLNFEDTDASAGDVNASIDAQATDVGDGTEDIDITLKQQVNGTPTDWLVADADGVVTIGTAAQNTTITGDLGIGVTAGNNNNLDIVSSPLAVVHVGTTDTTGYWMATTSADQILITAGYNFVPPTDFTARSTEAASLAMNNGVVSFFSNTGLTARDIFTPTLRFTINTSGFVGLAGTASPNHVLSAYVSNPVWALTDSDVNITTSSAAQAIDTSAIAFDVSGEPTIQLRATDGDASEITINTSDQMVFQNAATYLFDTEVNAGTKIVAPYADIDDSLTLSGTTATSMSLLSNAAGNAGAPFDTTFSNVFQSDVATGALRFTGATSATIFSTTTDVELTLDVAGSGGTAFVEVIDDDNAGFINAGRTTATEASRVSITDGGSDNKAGELSLYEDDGNASYLWYNTASVLRTDNTAPSDDDADGYAIIDASDGTIGTSAQAVNGSTITGTTITDGTLTTTSGTLTAAVSIDATNMSNGTTGNVTNWITVKVFNDSTVTGETTLTDVLPAGYAIEGIIFKNTTANEVTDFNIGFTDNGGEVVANGAIPANKEGTFTILQGKADFDAADTLYLSAANWNSANIIIYIRMSRYF